jgi:hypothetical protein
MRRLIGSLALVVIGCEAVLGIEEPTLVFYATDPEAGADVLVEASEAAEDAEIDAAEAGCVRAADCDDGDWCNGAERCAADGRCVAGKPPAAQVAVCISSGSCPDGYYRAQLTAGAGCLAPNGGPACCCETTWSCQPACAEEITVCCPECSATAIQNCGAFGCGCEAGYCKGGACDGKVEGCVCPKGYVSSGEKQATCFCGSALGKAVVCRRF